MFEVAAAHKYRIFNIGVNTQIFKEIVLLQAIGPQYIFSFEYEVGIDGFCIDMEVLMTNQELFLVVHGFDDFTWMPVLFKEQGVEEITERQLRRKMSFGKALRDVGSTQLLEQFGYVMEPQDDHIWNIFLNMTH